VVQVKIIGRDSAVSFLRFNLLKAIELHLEKGSLFADLL
jgi:hypothetical protein